MSGLPSVQYDPSASIAPHDAFQPPDYSKQHFDIPKHDASGKARQGTMDAFDPLKSAPDYSLQSNPTPTSPSQSHFDSFKQPPYEMQNWEEDDMKKFRRSLSLSRKERDEENAQGGSVQDDGGRGRRPMRSPSGATGIRSSSQSLTRAANQLPPLSADPTNYSDVTTGVIDGQERSISRSRAMGARSGSISRVSFKDYPGSPTSETNDGGEEGGRRGRSGSLKRSGIGSGFGEKMRRSSLSTGGRSKSIERRGFEALADEEDDDGVVKEEDEDEVGGGGVEERGRRRA